jgi:transposase
MLTDAQWTALEPLVEACRPHAKVPPSDLRRTMSAILWRHENGAKWRALPAELGPWWMAAQTFIRWAGCLGAIAEPGAGAWCAAWFCETSIEELTFITRAGPLECHR